MRLRKVRAGVVAFVLVGFCWRGRYSAVFYHQRIFDKLAGKLTNMNCFTFDHVFEPIFRCMLKSL